MRSGRVVAVVIGALGALIGFGLAAGGAGLLWAHTTQRDSSSFYTTRTERFDTSTYALLSRVDLGALPGEHDWTIAHPVGTVPSAPARARASRSSSASPRSPASTSGCKGSPTSR